MKICIYTYIYFFASNQKKTNKVIFEDVQVIFENVSLLITIFFVDPGV